MPGPEFYPAPPILIGETETEDGLITGLFWGTLLSVPLWLGIVLIAQILLQ